MTDTKMMSRAWAMTAATIAAILVLVVPTTALADPPDESGVVERAPVLSDPLFWDGELIVLVGPPLEQGCLGEGFHFPTATIVTTPNGDEITRYTDTDQVWVFDDAGVDDVLDWLIETACAAVWAGEPAPEPLAHGQGTVIHNVRAEADGDVHGTVRLTAPDLTAADGSRAHVNARTGCEPWYAFCGPADFINYGS